MYLCHVMSCHVMYVCMYMYVGRYVYMHVCMYACTHASQYKYVGMYVDMYGAALYPPPTHAILPLPPRVVLSCPLSCLPLPRAPVFVGWLRSPLRRSMVLC